jgi:hypothetical protein
MSFWLMDSKEQCFKKPAVSTTSKSHTPCLGANGSAALAVSERAEEMAAGVTLEAASDFNSSLPSRLADATAWATDDFVTGLMIFFASTGADALLRGHEASNYVSVSRANKERTCYCHRSQSRECVDWNFELSLEINQCD